MFILLLIHAAEYLDILAISCDSFRLAGKLQRDSKMMLKPAKIKVTWSRTCISEGAILGK